MKKNKLITSFTILAFLFGICFLFADWNEEDGHKMHWPQLPDLTPTGMDVDMFWVPLADDFKCTEDGPITDIHIWGSFADDILPVDGPESLAFQIEIYSNIPEEEPIWQPQVLADDFPCEVTGPITDIHIWGSWYHDYPPYGDPGMVTFTLSIHDDIPADQSPTGYSMPGNLLWKKTFRPYEFDVIDYAGGLQEGWYVPCEDPPYYEPDADTICFLYNFYIDPSEAFIQEGDPTQLKVYWLDVQAEPELDPEYQGPIRFGWKTTDLSTRWNDDGVYAVGEDPPADIWRELRYPMGHMYAGESLDLAFEITTEIMDTDMDMDLDMDIDIDIDLDIDLDLDTDIDPPGILQYTTKYIQPPDLDITGLDVDATREKTFSKPGEPLMGVILDPGYYTVREIDTLNNEDWYDPVTGWWSNDNHRRAFQYNFPIENTTFEQVAGNIYWLVIKHILPPEPYYTFGWKTTTPDLHFMDDATFQSFDWGWLPMEYPEGHEYEGLTLDLAFVINSEEEEPYEQKPLIEHSKWSQPPIEIDPCSTPPVYCGWDEVSFREYIEPMWFDAWNCRTQCHGDADCDGYVGLQDENIVNDALGSCYPEPMYDPRADFNHDLCVNPLDMAIYETYEDSYPPADCAQRPQFWMLVADDFRCLGTMPITSLHWWGSYSGWDRPSGMPPQLPIAWKVCFWSNVPADPLSSPCFSYPEELLWQVNINADRVDIQKVAKDYYVQYPEDICYQYNLQLDPNEWFRQSEFEDRTIDNIYWISIAAVYDTNDDIYPEYPWGWKTRPESWMDDAIRFYLDEPFEPGLILDPSANSMWPLEDPAGESVDVSFELDTDPNYIKWEQPFTGIRDWPHYEDIRSMATITEWTEQITKWSQKPDLEDINSIDVDATIEQIWKPQVLADDFHCELTGPITQIDVWGSWYHDHPPFDDPMAVTFTLSIHKDIPASESPTGYSIPGELLWKKQFFPGEFEVQLYEVTEEGWFVPCAEPPAYNSSADTYCFLYNFFIDPPDAFTQEIGNIYWLDVQAQPIFEAGWPEPIRFGWKNSYTEWNDDAVWAVGEDPPEGLWNELRYPPGHPYAGGSINLAFAIYTETAQKWIQWPELQPVISIDIDATNEEVWKPQVLADDFQCTDTEPITDIHIWTSWYKDYPPYGDANNVTFTLSIHEDIPAYESPTGYSMPGELLWSRIFQPGEFDSSIYARGVMEGWFVPCGDPPYYEEGADSICFEYDFYINDEEAFPQQGSEENPVTYWLDVQAQPETSLAGAPPEPIRSRLGWKTSWEHWNDDAVWAVGQDPPTEPWNELRYPTEHPFDGNSIDLAFEITGEVVHEELYIDKLVADDWFCERRTPVTAIAWFGSYLGYIYETPCTALVQSPPVPPDHFIIAIYRDVPADDPNNEYDFSHPGRKLWEYVSYDYDEVLVGYDKHPEDIAGPREPVYRYSVRLPEDQWFKQREVEGVYWISIAAVYNSNVTLNHQGWGWTIHEYVFGDNAVQGYWLEPDLQDEWIWEEIFDQTGLSADMSFILYTDPDKCVNCADYNWDDTVHFFDYAIFALDWMWTGPAGGYANGDLNCSGKVDFEDLEIFCNQWLDSCP